MDIILETPGTRVSKKQEMIKIDVPDHDSIEVPLREIESIIVGNNVQITSQALQTLSLQGISIVYTSLGKPFGIFTPFANVGTVFTRRQQILAYEDWRGVHLAIQFVYAAIENKRRLLLYFGKNRKKTDYPKYMLMRAAARELGRIEETLLKFAKSQTKGTKLNQIRMELMGVEGKAAAIYFQNYGSLFPETLKIMTRTRRPPRDPINALLSLGYTILQGHITSAISAAGLELYGGFLHSDRSGKPSLALDILEEFRQPIIDRLVANLVNKCTLKSEDFESTLQSYRLKDNSRSLYYNEIRKEILGGSHSEELFDASSSEPKESGNEVGRKIRINYKKEMVHQARKIANFLIGVTSRYDPFIMNW